MLINPGVVLELRQPGQIAVAIAARGFDDDLRQAAGHIKGVGGGRAADEFGQTIAQTIIGEWGGGTADGDADKPVGRIVGKGAYAVIKQIAII